MCLHVTETKSDPGTKRAELQPGMNFDLKENFPLSMKTYNTIFHFSMIC